MHSRKKEGRDEKVGEGGGEGDGEGDGERECVREGVGGGGGVSLFLRFVRQSTDRNKNNIILMPFFMDSLEL